MVGNFYVKRQQSRKNVISDHKTNDILPMKILNMVIPNLMHFLTFIPQKHIILHQMSNITRKPVFGVCDQVYSIWPAQLQKLASHEIANTETRGLHVALEQVPGEARIPLAGAIS